MERELKKERELKTMKETILTAVQNALENSGLSNLLNKEKKYNIHASKRSKYNTRTNLIVKMIFEFTYIKACVNKHNVFRK